MTPPLATCLVCGAEPGAPCLALEDHAPLARCHVGRRERADEERRRRERLEAEIAACARVLDPEELEALRTAAPVLRRAILRWAGQGAQLRLPLPVAPSPDPPPTQAKIDLPR